MALGQQGRGLKQVVPRLVDIQERRLFVYAKKKPFGTLFWHFAVEFLGMPLRATSQFQTAGNAVEVPPPGNRKLAAAGILCICVAAFVIQTELTQFVQLTMQYQKPFFLL